MLSANDVPISTHVLFCNALQKLSSEALWDPSTGENSAADTQSPPPLSAAQSASITATHVIAAEQESQTTHAPAPLEDARQTELRACYYQVIKETVTAATGRRLYARLASTDGGAKTLGKKQVSGAAAASAADRQSALRDGVSAFLHAIACREREQRRLSAACSAQLTSLPASSKLIPDVRQLTRLRHIPLSRWAGACRYNNWHVRCAVPCIEGTEKTAAKPRNVKQSSAAAPQVVRQPKALVVAETLVEEVQKYWKLHNEAAARARLEALRTHDTEAFVAHVSLLKISALLEIMEKTDAFMRRIGMRLEAQADTHAESAPPRKEQTAPACLLDGAAAPAVRNSDSDYARFRAYVASAKNEFKLMHRVDAFVARQPAGLQATLLPHQLDGLRFLASLHANRINGILADEMGVGKTIQTLAFLLYLKESALDPSALADANGAARHRCPHLVLAPLSVVREWREACEQFVSQSFRVGLFQELADPIAEAPDYDLLLLPIHAVRHAGAAATRVTWNYVVVDEAHKAVANLNTITAQSILALPCERRLVLTGTPLSSDLQELWSLLHFLNPAVFSDNDAFEEVFRRPFLVYGAKEMELTEEERGLLILRLHQVLRPFLLRRTKADIDTSLRMTYHRLEAPLSAVQQRLLSLLRQQKRTPAVVALPSSESDSDEESAEAAAATTSATEPQTKEEETVAVPHQSDAGDLAVQPPASCVAPGAHSFGDGTANSKGSSDCFSALVQSYLPGLTETAASARRQRQISLDRSLRLSTAGVSESTAQQLCNHAFLIPFFSQALQRHGLDELQLESAAESPEAASGAAAATLACSGKFLLLHLLLSRLYVAGHKVVLFTHWLDCVDLVREYLQSRGWDTQTEVLTGASSEAERKASVRRFRDDPNCLFFLLSIKAGGCGINLQSAHVVVMLDRDYTATNEDQALARVYRIGQRHTVRAIYLSTCDPSEQRVRQRAAEKNRPRQAIIDDGVYQVTERAAQETDEESGGGSLERERSRDGEQGGGEATMKAAAWESSEACISTSELWQSLSASATICPVSGSAAASSAAFWCALRSVVSALDALVLTEEDLEQDSRHQSGEEADPSGNTKLSNGFYLASESLTVAARLRATQPPVSDEELQQRLQASRMDTVQECVRDAAVSQRQRSPAGATPSGRTALAAGTPSCATEADKAHIEASEASTDQDGASVPGSPSPTVSVVDPLRHSATFWLEFAQLLRLSCAGPPLLWAALNTAELNESRTDDPAELRRRKERRDRRAARRVRLATVDVPDAFRERCWEEGLEEEDDIAARYLEHLDSRTRRARRRKTEAQELRQL